jgi:type I restriction enzyme S subunit
VPDGWAWCRLSDAIIINPKNTLEDTLDVSFVPMTMVDDQFSNQHISDTRKWASVKSGFTHFQEGDIGLAKITPCFENRKSVILRNLTNGYGAGTTELHILRSISEFIVTEYILWFVKSELFIVKGKQAFSGAVGQQRIGKEYVSSSLFPLPPYNEQQRIVDAISLAFTQIDIIEKDKSDLQTIIAQAKSKILDLAIRGKFVPQDPADEPASVLLERIRAEKEQLIKVGKIKRDKSESYIFRGDDKSYYQDKGGKRLCVEEMIPFDLPQQWLWCQLGEICDYGNCNNTDTATLPDDAWILDLEDIEKDTGKVLQRITVAKRKSNSTKHAFYNGQLLYSKLRPYLNKVLIADDDGYCTSEILPLEFANIIFPPYARHVLMSTYFLGYANQCSYGVKMPRLGTNDGKRAWIPLPPLSEQHRIAAAVDAAFAQLDTIADALV